MKLFGFNITREQRNKEEPRENYSYSEGLLFGTLGLQNSAMNLSAVNRAVSLISDTIALLPIKVKQTTATHKAELEKHPINLLFRSGLGYLTSFEFMRLLVQSVLLRGNGYAYIERATDGTATNLMYLEPSEVQIIYNKEQNTLYYQAPRAARGKIEPCNIIHLKKYSNDGINGISVLSYAQRSLKLSSYAEEAASNYFQSGCALSGILTVQGQLQDKQKQDIRNSWAQAYGAGGKGLAVLQGNMSYQAVQQDSAKSQLLESRLFSVSDIARWFGISPILLGDYSQTSYNSIEATQNYFLLHTLAPYIAMIEQEFTRKLFKPSEGDLSINLDETSILKTDKEKQANYFATLLDKGVLSPNEVRKELGYSDVEGLDKHFVAYTDIETNTINKEKTKEDEAEK